MWSSLEVEGERTMSAAVSLQDGAVKLDYEAGAIRSPDYEAGCWVQLRTMKLGALRSPPKSQPCPAAGVLLPKLTHVSSASVCWYPTPPSPDSPAPTPTRSIWVPAVHPRIRHSTNLGQNKVLYRFFSPMVPRALMRGERKKR